MIEKAGRKHQSRVQKSKKTWKKSFAPIVVSFIISVVMLRGVVASSAPTVSVNPSSIFDPGMGPGAQLTIDITVDYVEKLCGYQFLLLFDPAVLHGVSVENGPFLGSAGGTPIVYSGIGFDNEKGWLHLFIAELVPALPSYRFPTGGGILATVTFEVVGYGKSGIFLGSDTGLLNAKGEWIIQGLEYTTHGYFANTAEWHDVALVSITTNPPVTACQGVPIFISVTVENQGDFVETFDISVYADRNVGDLHFDIGVQAVQDLLPGYSETLTFNWDTTDVDVGTYIIYAEADAVSGEIAHTTNNIISTRFAGISIPKHGVTILEMLMSWAVLAGIALPGIVLAIGTIAFFKTLMSLKLRWPMRWLKRALQFNEKPQ